MANKVNFYVVSYDPNPSSSEDVTERETAEMVLTRTELVYFLRKGCKFFCIRPFVRVDFNNPIFFNKENDNG